MGFSASGSTGGPGFDPQVRERPGVVEQPVERQLHLGRIVPGGGEIPLHVLKGALEAVERRRQVVQLLAADHDVVWCELQLGTAEPRLVGPLATSLTAVPPGSAPSAWRGLERPGAPDTAAAEARRAAGRQRGRWCSRLPAPRLRALFRHVTILGDRGAGVTDRRPRRVGYPVKRGVTGVADADVVVGVDGVVIVVVGSVAQGLEAVSQVVVPRGSGTPATPRTACRVAN